MTCVTASENAAKVDLLAGKSGGLFHRWAQVRLTRNRKRMVQGGSNRAEHYAYDYLRPITTHTDEYSVFHPKPSLSETRFHRGFHRRRLPDCDEPRQKIDDFAWNRFNKRTADAISKHLENKTDIISGTGVPSPRPAGLRVGIDPASLCLSSREREDHRRNYGSCGRFFVSNGQRTAPEVPCESVIIGFTGGRRRNRATSVGVLDNFAHTQRPLDIVTPTSGRRNQSQILLG